MGARTATWDRPYSWATNRGGLDMMTRLDMRLDGVPKRVVYPVAGLLLAAGAPVGMLAVRALRARHWSTSWLKQDIETEWLDYLYVGGATAIAFALWGRLLGGKADDLIRMSAEDPLTGLLNARAFDRRLEQEVARAERTGEPLSLLMFDLDGLKTINDSYGHETGNRALRRMGDIVRHSMRLMDVSARVGGDEFALIVPGAGRDEALKLAERIRGQVAEDLSRIAPRVNGGTTSIGIASCDSSELVPTPGALARAADSALYEAKRTGRNRVVARWLGGNGDVSRPVERVVRQGDQQP